MTKRVSDMSVPTTSSTFECIPATVDTNVLDAFNTTISVIRGSSGYSKIFISLVKPKIVNKNLKAKKGMKSEMLIALLYKSVAQTDIKEKKKKQKRKEEQRRTKEIKEIKKFRTNSLL